MVTAGSPSVVVVRASPRGLEASPKGTDGCGVRPPPDSGDTRDQELSTRDSRSSVTDSMASSGIALDDWL